MDESLLELEAELAALRPRPPEPAWFDRIELDVAAPALAASGRRARGYATATNLSSWKWLAWRTAGVAAAFALIAAGGLVWWQLRPGPAPTPTATLAASPAGFVRTAGATRNRYEPVSATNVLYDLQAEDLANVGDEPARRVVVRYLDTYTWKNPATKASLTWSVPRDEVRVLPASLN